MISNPPLLSVRLMTYNHEKFIAQAIESCLSQETDFDFEIVIGDDFSIDNTLQICREYQSNYADKIRVLVRKEGDAYWTKRQELGRLWNFVDILNNCKGQYIALLDGDDYWIDPKKLQKQVNVLRGNSTFSFSFHKCYIKHKNKLVEKDLSFITDTAITQYDALTKRNYNFIPSSSIVLKKHDLPNPFPEWFFEQPMGDWILVLLLLKNNKKAFFYNELLSIYRQEGQGLWENFDDITLTLKKRDFIQNLKSLPFTFDRNHLNEIIRKYDEEIELYVQQLQKRDYYNLNVRQTLRHLYHRTNFAVQKLLGIKK